MIKHKSNHEIDAIRAFEKLGYTDSFKMVDSKLKNLNSGKTYGAKDLCIVKERRYEGMSNPADMSILYAIETVDGSKGTILTAYGPSADTELVSFLKHVPFESDKQNT